MSARTVTATVEGQRYEIPEMWLAGATRTRTYPEALQQWHEQAVAEAEFQARKIAPTRAILSHHPKFIGVLCHHRHVLEFHRLDRTFAGSAFQAEISAWQAGYPNRFDRLSAKCCPAA
jgi:hypothetical protein